jgi:hypothetical protein
MAVPFLAPIDLNKNEIRNSLLHLLASDPVSPATGQIWYNTTSNVAKMFDGTANRVLAELSNTLDQLGAPAADLSINSHKLTNVATPTLATDAATKGYCDSVALGLDVKASVRAATTAAGTLASSFANGSVIDGITLATGDRILVKNQAAGAENGIYVVAASGAPTRSTDCNSTTSYISGAFCFVESGTVNSGSSWVVSTQGTITPGTTAVTWVQFTGSIAYTAGSGLTLTGTVFSANVTGVSTEISGGNIRVKSSATSGQPLLSQGAGVEANYGALNVAGGASFVTGTLPIGNGGTGAATAAAARTALGTPSKFAAAIGDGSTTSIVVTHNLGTQDVVVQVYTASGTFAEVNVEIQNTSTNTITLVFAAAPTSGQYRVVVIG